MIKEALDAFVAPKVWQHDRTKTIGSSEIGQCARRIKYIKSGHPPDKEHVPRWGAAERGNLFEQYLWEPALRNRYGDKLLFAGKEQQTFIGDYLSATPDGMLTDQPRNVLNYLGIKDIGQSMAFMVECKTIDPRVNLSEAKHTNVMQTQIQMGMIRKHAPRYKHVSYALLSYANASFIDDITEFAIKFDQDIFDRAGERARIILEAKTPKDLRPEGWIAGGKECDHCPFLRACGIEPHNLPNAKYNKPIDPQFRAEMVDMVRAANVVQEKVDEFSAELRHHKDSIKQRLREKGVRKIDGVVTWIDVKGRISYDDEAIRAYAVKKGLDIEKFSNVGDSTDRLTLDKNI